MLFVQLATIFSCSRHPPPPLINVRFLSTSSAPSITTSNWNNIIYMKNVLPRIAVKILINQLIDFYITWGNWSRLPSFRLFWFINCRAWKEVGMQVICKFSLFTLSINLSTAYTTVDPLPIPTTLLFCNGTDSSINYISMSELQIVTYANH